MYILSNSFLKPHPAKSNYLICTSTMKTKRKPLLIMLVIAPLFLLLSIDSTYASAEVRNIYLTILIVYGIFIFIIAKFTKLFKF